MKHYLYRHIRLDKNEPFYIGIGTKSNRVHPNSKSEYRRAFEVSRKESYIWKNIIAKTDYRVEIVLESDDYSFIKEKEKEFIKLYGRLNLKTGILSNMTDGGDGTLNIIVSDNWRKLHSEQIRGRVQSEEEKLKRNKSREGYTHSEETKRKISEAHKGKKIDKEHFIKLVQGQIIANSKPITQYDMNDNIIKEWKSATEAAKIIGLHPTSIRHCVQGKTNSSGGYVWKSQISYK